MVFQSKDSNYKFHHLLIYIIILLYDSNSKNIKLSLINNESQITITFKNKGNNAFLSNHYNGLNLLQYMLILLLLVILTSSFVISMMIKKILL